MNHIYFGFTLSFICLFLACFFLPKFILVTVVCVFLAGVYFKDDFILFRYIATHVASFNLWICDIYLNIQNMYHQSNNTTFPIRRSIENNGAVSKKFDRLHPGSSYNLSTTYAVGNKSNSGIWDSGSTYSSPSNSFNNVAQSSLRDMSKLSISHQVRGKPTALDHYSKPYNSPSVSPLTKTPSSYPRTADLLQSGSSSFLVSRDHSSNNENKPPVDAKLYADVSSPGFCGRIADRLNEESVTHQSKYDSVGSFPIVNLKSQSPKIKIKTPVRVRLAPPTNELIQYNYGANSLSRSPIVGPDDSMKSVLQVLKEISRKRIHSHVDEEDEETTKRSRVTDSQFAGDGLHHTSLLQQTIQGKRVREESSPNEDDKKRRKASLKNNEILSSLSSSLSVRPPHLQTAKRKAQSIDDSLTSTPVLGKLLKVQTEVSPPSPTNHIAAPEATATITASASPKTVKETTKTSPLLAVPSPIAPPPAVTQSVQPHTEPPKPVERDDEGAVSRLLGRMAYQTSQTRPIDIPIKKNVFMSTNDLSLSPPKENRLAAMIAVLGGPSEQSELEGTQPEESKQPERLIKGKALFTSPETPATPESAKQKKNVTFSAALTTTKIFERDETDNGSSVGSKNLTIPSTPLSSFSPSGNTISTGLKFGSENSSPANPLTLNFISPSTSTKEAQKPNVTTIASTVSSPSSQKSIFQTQSASLQSSPSSANILGSSFSGPDQVSKNNSANGPITGGFSFGTNSSVSTTIKEDVPKLNSNTPAGTPFSFGASGETKTTQDSGLPSLFSPVASKTETSNTVQSAGTGGQNKTMFNMFGNKDTKSQFSMNGNENKPLVNGFAPPSSNSSQFVASQPVSQTNANKLPSFQANSHHATANTSQSPSSVSFGSTTAFSTGTSAVSTQQSTTAVSSPLNIFSSAASASPSKSNPFAGVPGMPAFGQNSSMPPSSNSQAPQTNAMFGSASSGFGSSSTLQNGTVSSSIQSNNLFGNVSSPTKPATFGNESKPVSQQSSVFGFSTTTASTQASSPFGVSLNSSTSTAPTNNTSLNTPTMFGNTTTPSAPTMFGNTTTSNAPTMFGNTTTSNAPTMFGNTTSNAPTMFGNTTTSNTPKMFGNTTTPSAPTMFGNTTTSNAPTMFGNTTTSNTPAMFGNTASSSTPTMFGNTTSAQSSSVFGSGTPSVGSQSNTLSTSSTTAQSTMFGAPSSSDASKNMFASATNSTPTFGGLGSTNPSFGNQTNSTPAFGSQNTTTASTFGNQTTPAFAFGSQNSTNTSQGFGTSGAFGANTSSSSSEVKPPAFGSSSPFNFGSSSATKPMESVKPLGTATRFAFTAQPSSSAQPAVVSFGGGFGSGPANSTFGAATTQPVAPTPSGGFQFGQASSAAPTFQFNAAPAMPTAGGGMFSIGSGGSSTSRAKTAVRRSHKRT